MLARAGSLCADQRMQFLERWRLEMVLATTVPTSRLSKQLVTNSGRLSLSGPVVTWLTAQTHRLEVRNHSAAQNGWWWFENYRSIWLLSYIYKLFLKVIIKLITLQTFSMKSNRVAPTVFYRLPVFFCDFDIGGTLRFLLLLPMPQLRHYCLPICCPPQTNLL